MSALFQPKLRFRNKTSSWKEEYLYDVVSSFERGRGISNDDKHEDGKVFCVTYGDLYTVYSELINKVIFKTDITKDLLKLSDEDDVLIPSSGETHIDIARASCISMKDIAIGADLTIIKSHLHGPFLAYYLSGKKKKELAKYAQGSSVIHLYSKHFKNLRLFYPDKEEQQKIASFLSSVDKKIELLTKKHEQLEKYKKGLMQKIFSQEIRFKQDDGSDFPDWVEGYLGDYGKLIRGLSYSNNNILKKGLLVLRSSNIQNNQIWIGDNVYVDKKIQENLLTQVNDIIICANNGSKRLIGKSAIVKKEITNSTHGAFMFNFRGEYNQFIFQWLQTPYFFAQVRKNLGATINSINKSDLEKYKSIFPTVHEQQKIASFLSSIDKKIDLVKQQLEKTQTFKKGLLQQMFV